MDVSVRLDALLESLRNLGLPCIVGVLHKILHDHGMISQEKSCSTDRVHAGLIKGTDTEWRPAGFEVAQSLLALCMSPDNASQQAMPGELSVRPKGKHAAESVSGRLKMRMSMDQYVGKKIPPPHPAARHLPAPKSARDDLRRSATMARQSLDERRPPPPMASTSMKQRSTSPLHGASFKSSLYMPAHLESPRVSRTWSIREEEEESPAPPPGPVYKRLSVAGVVAPDGMAVERPVGVGRLKDSQTAHKIRTSLLVQDGLELEDRYSTAMSAHRRLAGFLKQEKELSASEGEEEEEEELWQLVGIDNAPEGTTRRDSGQSDGHSSSARSDREGEERARKQSALAGGHGAHKSSRFAPADRAELKEPGGEGSHNPWAASVTQQASGASPYSLATVIKEQKRKRQLQQLVRTEHLKAMRDMQKAEHPPNWWNMHPKSKMHQVWDIIMTLALNWTLLVTPFQISFEPIEFEFPRHGYWIDLFITFLFLCDMIICLVTGVYMLQVHEKSGSSSNEESKHGGWWGLSLWGTPRASAAAPAYKRSKSAGQHGFRASMMSVVTGVMHRSSRVSAVTGDLDDMMYGSHDDAENTHPSLEAPREKLSYCSRDIIGVYLKGYFFVDFISVVPWDLMQDVLLISFDVGSSSNIGAAPRMLKLIRLTRLTRLMKVHRLFKVLGKLSKNVPPTVLELTKLSVYTLLVVHYISCGFYYIAILEDNEGRHTWLDNYGNWPRGVDGLEFGNMGGVSQQPAFARYLVAIYWGFTTITTVGYGDIVPITDNERMYSLLAMYAGIALMSVITGKLTTILSYFMQHKAQIQAQMQSVHTYCRYRQLPMDLRRSVVDYFGVRTQQRATCNEEKILSELSPSLKAQVVCYIFRDVIESVPFFRGCDDLFLSEVISCMEPLLFAPADIIIKKGQLEPAMYVISKGRAAILDDKFTIIKNIHEGEFCGEIGLFFGVCRTATIVALVFCDTFKLSQDKFLEVLEMYPAMQDRLDAQTEQMFNGHIHCYLCGEAGHISVQCRMARMRRGSHMVADRGIRIPQGGSMSDVVKSCADRWIRAARTSLENRRSTGDEDPGPFVTAAPAGGRETSDTVDSESPMLASTAPEVPPSPEPTHSKRPVKDVELMKSADLTTLKNIMSSTKSSKATLSSDKGTPTSLAGGDSRFQKMEHGTPPKVHKSVFSTKVEWSGLDGQ